MLKNLLIILIIIITHGCNNNRTTESIKNDPEFKPNLILEENDNFVYTSRPNFIKTINSQLFVLDRFGKTLISHDLASGSIINALKIEDLDLQSIIANFCTIYKVDLDDNVIMNDIFKRSLKFSCYVNHYDDNILEVVLCFNYPEIGNYVLNGKNTNAQYWRYGFSILRFNKKLELESYIGIKSEHNESIFTGHNCWISKNDTLIIPMQFQLKNDSAIVASRYIYDTSKKTLHFNKYYSIDSKSAIKECNLIGVSGKLPQELNRL